MRGGRQGWGGREGGWEAGSAGMRKEKQHGVVWSACSAAGSDAVELVLLGLDNPPASLLALKIIPCLSFQPTPPLRQRAD